MLKAQLHTHIKEDKEDFHVNYSIFELIDSAKKNKIDVLGITCHDMFFYDKKAFDYAKKKGIILIFGIEKTIENKHVLILNTSKKAEKISDFKELIEFKRDNPNILIIAPHPYHHDSTCLKDDIIRYKHVFDAFEYSFFYTKQFNPNKKTEKIAKELNKPLIATSDVHYLEDMNLSYTMIDSKKTSLDIIKAIKNGRIQITINPLNIFNLIFRVIRIMHNAVLESFKKMRFHF